MKNATVNEKIEDFCKLVDSLKIADKKKEIWKEIYANAINDRDYAIQMYMSVISNVTGDPTQHVIHGPIIAKYIERMSRANDQLIKLAELIATAEEVALGEATLSPEQIYDRLGADDSFPKVASKR